MTEDKTTKAAEKTAHIDYRPDIDGLRAVAVMMVVLYHAGFGFPGGFIGVDVFFVISGYLITGLIRKQQEAGTFSLAQFWHRRICRIVPAATLVVAATMIAGWFLLFPQDYNVLARSAIAQQLMMSNLYFWKNTGYFDGPSELMPLLHTWSLAVEEQFYLFYPFLLVVLAKASRVKLTIALATLFVISLATSEVLCWISPQSAFYLLPSRAWEMLLGGIIALIPPSKFGNRAIHQTLALFGIAGILVASFTFETTMRFPGIWALVPCAATAILIAGNSSQKTWASKFLSLKPVVVTGQMSYSIYLWHWPILAFGRYWLEAEQFQWFAAASVVATLLVSYASWCWVERPIRKWGQAGRVRISAKRLITSVMVLAGTLGFIVLLEGVPSRVPKLAQEYASTKSRASHVVSHNADDVRNGRVYNCGDKTSETKLLVWGDSHAMAIMPAFEKLCNELPIHVSLIAHSATAPLVDFKVGNSTSLGEESMPYSAEVIKYCKREEIDVVVLVAYWSYYAGQRSFLSSLRNTVSALKRQGVEVWVAEDVPNFEDDVPLTLARQAYWGIVDPPAVSVEAHYRNNSTFNRAFEDSSLREVKRLDFASPLMDSEGTFSSMRDGVVLFRDTHHLTIEGAELLVPLVRREIVTYLESQVTTKIPR